MRLNLVTVHRRHSRSASPWRDLERLLGPEHPDTHEFADSLAAAYRPAGRVPSDPAGRTDPGRAARCWVPMISETLISPNNLASVYRTGPDRDAIRLYELNLDVFRGGYWVLTIPATPELKGQPRRRLPGWGPGRRGDPLLRSDLAARNECWARSPRSPGHTEEQGGGWHGLSYAGGPPYSVPLLGDLQRPATNCLRSPRSHTVRKNSPSADRAADRVADRIPPPSPSPSPPEDQPLNRALGNAVRSASPASRRSGKAGASCRLPPTPAALSSQPLLAASQPPAGYHPFIHHRTPEPPRNDGHYDASCLRRSRRRSGGHRHGIRQLRGGPVRLSH